MHVDPEVALEERNPILSILPGGIQFMDLDGKNGSNEGSSFWNFKLMMEVTDPNVDERYCEWSWRWVIADFGSSLYGRNLVGHWMITEGRGLNMQSLKVAVSQLWCANLPAVSGKFRTLSQWWGEVTVTLANLPGGLQCIAHAAPIPFERCMERLGCEGSVGWLFSRYPSKVAAFLGVILRQ